MRRQIQALFKLVMLLGTTGLGLTPVTVVGQQLPVVLGEQPGSRITGYVSYGHSYSSSSSDFGSRRAVHAQNLTTRIQARFRTSRQVFQLAYTTSLDSGSGTERSGQTSQMFSQNYKRRISRTSDLEWRLNGTWIGNSNVLPQLSPDANGHVDASDVPLSLAMNSRVSTLSNTLVWSKRMSRQDSVSISIGSAWAHSNSYTPDYSVNSHTTVSAVTRLAWDHKATKAVGFGVIFEQRYISEVNPTHHLHFSSVRFAYRHELGRKFHVVATLGPSATVDAALPNSKSISYAGDVTVSREISKNHLAFSVRRGIELRSLQPGTASITIAGSANRSLFRNWNVFGAIQYAQGSYNGIAGTQSWGGAGGVRYRLRENLTSTCTIGYSVQGAGLSAASSSRMGMSCSVRQAFSLRSILP